MLCNQGPCKKLDHMLCCGSRESSLSPASGKADVGAETSIFFSEHQAEAMQPLLFSDSRELPVWKSKAMDDPNTNLSGESFPPYH